MRTLWFRLLTGQSSIVHWGGRGKFIGDGSLEFGPSVRINDDVRFSLSDSGGVCLRDDVLPVTAQYDGKQGIGR